jgi:excisionase family DNA binding protein
MDEFYSPGELASALKVSSRTIYNMIRAGKIKAVEIGVGIGERITYRIYKKELDRFIAENYQKNKGG